VVIDDDLGVSAATADSRKGFARLVTEVTMGRVGVVRGIEMSRLARTGRDWHQLLGAVLPVRRAARRSRRCL
jgi:DNA invertase Pin-like site-specific DNA recombinase